MVDMISHTTVVALREAQRALQLGLHRREVTEGGHPELDNAAAIGLEQLLGTLTEVVADLRPARQELTTASTARDYELFRSICGPRPCLPGAGQTRPADERSRRTPQRPAGVPAG